jgi:hypothetical protein
VHQDERGDSDSSATLQGIERSLDIILAAAAADGHRTMQGRNKSDEADTGEDQDR